MPRVLVVDDSATDRVLAGRLLQQQDEFEVRYATNGREALDSVRGDLPDVIVSDLQMPEMDGLELVAAIRRDFPALPVVLMTARGSEAIAAAALRSGAASYVPKVCLGDDLRDTVRRILMAARADRMHSRLMHSLEETDCHFRLRNDIELIDPLTAHMMELLRCIPLSDEGERLRVGEAVKHAVWIAHHHGNLELPFEGDMSDRAFREMAAGRRSESPYAERSLLVFAHISAEQAIFRVRHEGPGIDESSLPRDVEAHAVEHAWLGGFVFIPTVMDDVQFADGGREMRLLKKAVFSADLDFAED